jgi:hypothetical protein
MRGKIGSPGVAVKRYYRKKVRGWPRLNSENVFGLPTCPDPVGILAGLFHVCLLKAGWGCLSLASFSFGFAGRFRCREADEKFPYSESLPHYEPNDRYPLNIRKRTDFIIARDGRIAALYLFFDKLP